MLATFAVGLREGLEAALIVGIVAGFLRQRGERSALRPMWIGVVLAVLLCLGIALLLKFVFTELSQDQAAQEGLETVIGLIAVGMITYMIVWMRRHARGMRRELEAAAENALANGSTRALVVMAFLAVLREGVETTAILLGYFSVASGAVGPAVGLVLGVALAVLLGWGIYRGSVKINLSRFFTITGVFLVVVAAGVLAGSVHSAHEAGWLDVGQTRVADLSVIVQPGTPLEALMTGVLGIQPQPVWAELIAWLIYLLPMLAFVLWPQGRRRSTTTPAPVDVATS